MKEKWMRAGVIWAGVFAFRFVLLPVRAPNVEPLMAAVMPVSRVSGAFASILFAASSIALYDAVTSGIGIWTLITAAAYGLVALLSHFYFSFRAPTRGNFVGFGIAATLLYDALTGLTVGPLFFGQSFTGAFVGQIPFTALHLLGTVLFAALLSPALMRFLAPASETAEARELSTVRLHA